MRWLLIAALLTACNDSSGMSAVGPRPTIVTIAGPKDATVTCDPAATSGACALPIAVTFHLAKDEFVSKAYVRFQGDGSETGVDRGYILAPEYGQGDTTNVALTIQAEVPSTILRRGALFTYSVRIVTGNGEESAPSTLTVSVQ